MFTAIIIAAVAYVAYYIFTNEDRARKAQADETMRQLAAIHDETMRSVGMHDMVGKSSFHKGKD